jgi:hypothetical protein
MSQNVAGFANAFEEADDFCMDQQQQLFDVDDLMMQQARQNKMNFKELESTGEYCETHYYKEKANG